MSWKSINVTAPELGEQVIGWYPDAYADGCMQFVTREKHGRSIKWTDTDGDEVPAPSHWMASPRPPSPQEAGNG